MKNNYKILALILLSLLSSHVFAQSRTYKIELLIFSQDLPNSEVFDQTESQVEWPSRVANRLAYKGANPRSMSLHGSYARLAGSENYQPVMHVAWIQSVQSNRRGRAVKITNPEGTINGFFQLQRGHLVHMIADLEYSPGSVVYRINEKRRFKLKETHYLDHPKFGVLVRVSPY